MGLLYTVIMGDIRDPAAPPKATARIITLVELAIAGRKRRSRTREELAAVFGLSLANRIRKKGSIVGIM